MKFIDWVAIIGALAWLPPILGYFRAWLTKPKVRILTNPAPELGFSTYGPILNMRIAFIVERKDIVISGLKMKVRHESGSEQEFVWQGIVQALGRLNNQQIGNMPFERESSVLAIKAKTSDVEERFVRFQDADFLDGKQDLDNKVASKIMYLKRQKNEVDLKALLKSDEMTDLYNFVKRSFSWKEGSYHIEFNIESPQEYDLIGNSYSFLLNQIDIEELEKNHELIELDYRYRVIPRSEGEPELAWAWRNPKLTSIDN
ncbi:MAG: hypothetical protein ACRETO_10385 [Gammaproteobacteria bacterium]